MLHENVHIFGTAHHSAQWSTLRKNAHIYDEQNLLHVKHLSLRVLLTEEKVRKKTLVS
jgi:hypothetical protein